MTKYIRILIMSIVTVSLVYLLNNYAKSKQHTESSSYIIEGITPISQHPHYPTGCETVTAVMALSHIGFRISVDEFINLYLICDQRFYRKNFVLYGPDPFSYFVGDPRSSSSYGCMSPVIQNALVSCVGNKNAVINTGGLTLNSLCEEYINNNIPVILWASIDMKPIRRGSRWILPDNSMYTWPSNEHCLLLIGYDENNYIFNDPTYGKIVSYPKKLVEKRYRKMGMQSLILQ